MFFGLDVEKILVLGFLAAMIVGPQKLPGLAQQLARLVVRVRSWGRDAKERLKEEMGDDFDAEEWRRLDPRQYDPRRIIREALLEDAPVRPPAEAVRAAATVPTPPLTPLGGALDPQDEAPVVPEPEIPAVTEEPPTTPPLQPVRPRAEQ